MLDVYEGLGLMFRVLEMEGIASIALLPSGSISGHFVHPLSSTCFGLYGTEIPCARECSRAEDYRLINLTILDYKSKEEWHVIVECRGGDFARFHNVSDVHGWEEDVIQAAESVKHSKVQVSFECDVLKADQDAEIHLHKFLPALVNRGVVVNVGKMTIAGLDVIGVTNGDEHKHEESKDMEGDEFDLKPGEAVQEKPTERWIFREDQLLSALIDEELQAEELHASAAQLESVLSSVLQNEVD